MRLRQRCGIACFQLTAIATIAGCGDDNGNNEGGANGTTNASTSTASVTNTSTGTNASSASSTAETTSTTAGSSSSGAPTVPCIPAYDADRSPTAGTCTGNVATVCDPQTSTLTEVACGAGEVCKEYPLVRHLFDQTTLQLEENGSFVWAGCVPMDPVPCELAFDGITWTSTAYPAHCDAANRLWCTTPPTPFFPSAEFRSGTADGYVHVVPCAQGALCREPLSGTPSNVDALGCFDANAATCTGDEMRCEGDVAHACAQVFGYELVEDCTTAGKKCMEGCEGFASCVPTDTQLCDPAVQPSTCETIDSYLWCSDQCLTARADCSTVPLFDPDIGIIDVPGDCLVIDHGPACLPEGTVTCDSSLAETCDGDVAKRCVGGVPTDQQCKAGDVCLVGNNGKAGCTFPGAMPCAPNAPRTCDMTLLQGCCDADGQIFASNYRCAPGFEATFDCASLSGWTCDETSMFVPAHCQSP